MRLARTRKEQPTTSNCSLRLAMFTCGACADEIVVQEGIRHPGHACKSPLHAPLQYLHSATMCDAVWQPLEDGEDTFCSKACVAAYNAKLKAEHEDGLAGVPVEDEPLPPPDFLPLRQREGEDMELDEEPEATTADQHTPPLPAAAAAATAAPVYRRGVDFPLATAQNT